AIALLLAVIGALVVLRSSGSQDRAEDAGAVPLDVSSASGNRSPGEASGLPRCRYGDEPALDSSYRAWRSTILDTTFRLPSTYEPPDLVSVRRAGFAGTQTARKFVMPDLSALRRAADAAGNPIDIIWGYRSFTTQQSVFQRSVALKGYDRALLSAARPGHSEHQLGTVFDFKTLGAANVFRTWESEPAGAWMARNAWRYGFVMSYPRGREDETCYEYEPWHYRYLGRELAAEVHASGETTRAYLWTHRASP
ncbi:MAG: M15 family metallopeptidase, partial [Actinomycetota bacterium]|nr:M15 family metallopeptidase [Actinomycetota bacterium]